MGMFREDLWSFDWTINIVMWYEMKNQTEACEGRQEDGHWERWVFLISLVVHDGKFTAIGRVNFSRVTLKGWRNLCKHPVGIGFFNRVIPCQINQFFAKFARPLRFRWNLAHLKIMLEKKICANFQRCRSSGFRDMTFEKRVDFCDKTSQSNVNNFFSIRGRKLHDSSF